MIVEEKEFKLEYWMIRDLTLWREKETEMTD